MTEPTRGRSLHTLLIAERFPPAPNPRGRFLRELVAHLPAEGTVLCAPGARGAHAVDRGLQPEVRRSFCPPFLPSLARRMWRSSLRWTVRRRPPGLVVAFDPLPDGEIARDLMRTRDVPYVLHLDAPELFALREGLAAGNEGAVRARAVLEDAVAIVTASRACRLEAYKLGVMPHRLEVVPPGVDLERYRPGEARAAVLQRLGRREGPVVVTAAGPVPGIDLETVLRAFAVVRTQVRGSHLVVLDLEEPRPWRKVLRKLRIDRAVHFVPPASEADRADWYRSASVYLGAWREDREAHVVPGVDVAPLEAMATGLPVVATAVGSIEELLPLDGAGRLVESGAHAKLGKAAADLLRDAEALAAAGAAARTHVEAHHDARARGRELRELLEVIYFRRLRLGTLDPVAPDAAPAADGTGSARTAA